MKKTAHENLFQLKDLLNQLSEEQYQAKPEILFGASIGQHMRHIIEFYLLLVSQASSGHISYDKRERDIRIEENTMFAIEMLNIIEEGLDKLDLSASLTLDGDYTEEGEQESHLKSSLGRELAYCIEHSIHHQAIIKSGLIALDLRDLTNEHFGVAYSTIRYRKEEINK